MAFGNQEAAYNAVNSMWAPVIKSGAIPYGYSPQLDQLLQANIMSTGSQAEANAMNEAALQAKQASGGADVLPSGAQEAINAQIAATGQQKIASGLQQEKISGYQQGVSNLEAATQATLGAAGLESPTGLASGAVGAGGLQLQAGEAQFAENQATSGWADLGHVAGAIGDIGQGMSGIGDFASIFTTPAPQQQT